MSIQRYDTEDEMFPIGSSDPVHKTWREGEGLWVLYADHVAAVGEENEHWQKVVAEILELHQQALADCRTVALDEAHDAVAALSTPDDLTRHEALAAIDALRGTE